MDADEKIQELPSDVLGLTALLMVTMRDLARLTLLPIGPRDNSDMVNPSVGVIAVGVGFSSLIC